MQSYKASCHCGAVKFSFEAEPFTKGIRCSCTFCSRRGTLMYPVPDGSFKVEAQDGALATYQFGPKVAKHYFCKQCGISTHSRSPRRPGMFIVNLGCVEGVDTFALETTVYDGLHLL